jgi:hypothetical protein
LATDQDHDLLGSDHGGVQQVALQHQPGAGRHRHDHAGILAALGAVDADRIRMGQLVQLIELIAHLLVLIHQHSQLAVLQREGGDDPDRAVEHPGGTLVVVVPKLHDPVADPVDAAAETALRKSLARWSQRGLEPLIQHAGPSRPGDASGTAPGPHEG